MFRSFDKRGGGFDLVERRLRASQHVQNGDLEPAFLHAIEETNLGEGLERRLRRPTASSSPRSSR
jgi:hypothetical protein